MIDAVAIAVAVLVAVVFVASAAVDVASHKDSAVWFAAQNMENWYPTPAMCAFLVFLESNVGVVIVSAFVEIDAVAFATGTPEASPPAVAHFLDSILGRSSDAYPQTHLVAALHSATHNFRRGSMGECAGSDDRPRQRNRRRRRETLQVAVLRRHHLVPVRVADGCRWRKISGTWKRKIFLLVEKEKKAITSSLSVHD